MGDINSLVSVIIPCYNCFSTIGKTLECLEKQSYSNIEIILINDGSKDETEKIINEYLKKSKMNIRYFLKQNEGVSNARNLGIQKSIGKYILFLDSDDVYHFDFIRCMVNAIECKNVDTAYSFWSRNINYVLSQKKMISNNNVSIVNQKQIMQEFLYNKGKIGFCNFIYRKSIISKYLIKFTPYRRTGEDIEFTWKYLCHCKNGAIVNAQIYGYYNNPSSVVNSVFWERTNSLKSIVAVEEYMKSYDCDFYDEFKGYMYSRAIWSYAKTFARGKRKDLFNRLCKEYNVYYHMRNMRNNAADWKVRFTSFLYCVHPNLFYFTVSMI